MNSPLALIAHPDALVLDLRAGSGEAAVKELHSRLGNAGGAVIDPVQWLAALRERMALGSVGIAADIALPHARTNAVSRLVLAIGRAVGDVAFDANHPAVRLIFLVGTPKAAVADYLQLVAGLSRWLKPAATRRALLAAAGENEFRAVLASAGQR